jgi:hypothetical protein
MEIGFDLAEQGDSDTKIGWAARLEGGHDIGLTSVFNPFAGLLSELFSDPWLMCLFVPEGKRLHSIIEGVVSADKMTSTPSEIISSSINNLTIC